MRIKKISLFFETSVKGFTLVELLVVIAILAILGVFGIMVFTGAQAKSRDAKRKADIQQMSKAMESHFTTGSGYLTELENDWFADHVIPVNPVPGGATYYINLITSSSYVFCAALEKGAGNASGANGSGTSGDYFCQRNKQ